jgi:hypothetical protein
VRLIESKDVIFVEIPSDMYRPHTTSAGASVKIPYDSVVPFIQGVMKGTFRTSSY